MKKIIFTLAVVMISKGMLAQVPQAMNYQAIARNSMGQIVPTQNIGVRFTILDLTGTNILYQETHNTSTNNFGLFTLAIGEGTPVNGTFAGIAWGAAGDKYLKAEIAPQGGANYTIQGITQLLSVPYALYADKTKLVGGNAVTITNGNVINANYVAGTAISIAGNVISGNYEAGPGINIIGNTISATAVNAWLLNGNTATTADNFLGTTDNQPLRVRTNNINRFTIDAGQNVGGGNYSIAYLSDFANMTLAPAQLQIYGKDVPGVGFPLSIHASVAGMDWGLQGGGTHTLGRMIRLTQFPGTSATSGLFYDFGIDQGGSYYLSDQSLSSQGPVFPRKIFTISPLDFVGINFNWGEAPTANFHTKGTLRFEGVNTNNTFTRVMVMDANGNAASRDASTLGGFWVADTDGIHNNNAGGHVGIGGSSNGIHKLNVEMMENRIDGAPMAKFSSNDTWQTNLWMFNSSNNTSFSFIIGGSANTFPNYGVGAGGFGIANQISSITTIPLIITPDNKVGISNSLGGMDNLPKSRLHVRDGDVYIDQIGSGVIMKSPNGQCWRMTVSDAGAPVFTSIPCP